MEVHHLSFFKSDHKPLIKFEAHDHSFDLIDEAATTNHYLSSTIDSIKDMVNDGANVRWSKIPRNNNKAAHILAKSSLSLCYNFVFYNFVPPAIQSIILEDSERIAFM